MTDTINYKMYEISKYLGELNAKGKIKKFAREKGYAKVLQIRRGCSIWVHHLNDDRLIIDLQITKAAGNRYPDYVAGSVELFEDFFKNATDSEGWQHPIDERNAQRYLVDVSKKPLDDILNTLRKIRERFSNLEML
ncbi:MAG: hypothetical protein B6I30_06635 [Desulfobacteraceae bacterium 4572_187]|nr:MAG: hypothetical protein B6I30_06635 [Desulfobacteraceae bacterium 4572_187]